MTESKPEKSASKTPPALGRVEQMKNLLESKIEAENDDVMLKKKTNTTPVHEKVLYTLRTLKNVISCCIHIQILE